MPLFDASHFACRPTLQTLAVSVLILLLYKLVPNCITDEDCSCQSVCVPFQRSEWSSYWIKQFLRKFLQELRRRLRERHLLNQQHCSNFTKNRLRLVFPELMRDLDWEERSYPFDKIKGKGKTVSPKTRLNGCYFSYQRFAFCHVNEAMELKRKKKKKTLACRLSCNNNHFGHNLKVSTRSLAFLSFCLCPPVYEIS